MIVYKIDVIKELSKRGYTTTRLRREKLLGESTLTHLRRGEGITTNSLNNICLMLRCQPADVIEVRPTDTEKIKYY